MKNIGFVTFDKFLGKKGTGSTRIRAKWVIEKINNLFKDEYKAEEFMHGKKYDVVVYQKSYWVEHAKEYKGLKILDLCDPDWMHWQYNVKKMIDEIDIITCSSIALQEYVKQLTDKPVYFIPDRLNLETFTEVKKHRGDLKTVAWYGYYTNFPALTYAIKALDNRNLELIVVSDSSYSLPVGIKNVKLTNFKWTEATVNNDLLRADAVLNPSYKKGRFKFKSDNKTVNAWALGLPVLQTDEDFDAFKLAETRNEFITKILPVVKDQYDVAESAKDLIGIIKQYETAS